ncbi:MAG: acetolactate synthase small subunit [Melioribacteraceae bacterium]|jgi:acetolactate synthase-1/3 small subunit|nr:acetolactate synthase small subunit [Ignavibacteriota bacterium]MBZ0182133.1 acetolactate synthase small subunit [Melioribacteraceae bacterium]|tara:strand:- start:88 stop:588 length:501 start_codon:yes stop_codon:yes gene_type:complete
MKHIISVLVENQFGTFNRVVTMFSGKGFNVSSLSIGETENPEVSRMTIVTSGDDKIIEQVVKQLNRLIDTIKVVDLTEAHTVQRELALVTVNYQKSTRAEIIDVCEIFRGKIVDINNKSMMIEITGPPEKIDAAVNVLEPFGIKEMARSGNVALKRGEQLSKENSE